jgi:hypothetical protein
MYSELTGAIPKLPVSYAKTLVNRAWADINRQNLWSYQLYEASWVSPSAINAGAAQVNQGSTTVVFNAAASAALSPLLLAGPFPTNLLQRQFRVGISTIYNIWQAALSSGILTITLDRPYTDVTAAATPYSVFQCYYPAPYQDHLLWVNVRDIVNFNDLVTTLTRKQIDLRDPQRTIFYLPTHVVPYQNDLNPASQTYGFQLFELWGQPQFQLVYQLYGIRRGAPLVNDSDVLPFAVGEDAVMAKAREYAYEWAEGNKGDMPRDQGSDFRFLMGKASAEYQRLVRSYRKDDRERVDNWFEIRRLHSWLSNVDGYYRAIGNTANPGAPW